MTPVAIGLFGAAVVHGVHAGRRQAKVLAGRLQHLEHVRCELGGDIELPAQFAHIGDAAGPHAGITHFDLLRGAEREGGVGQVLARHLLQQRPRLRSHHRDHRQPRCDVGRHAMRVRRRVALQPGHVARLGCGTGNDKELVVLKPGHRQVGLDAATLVQPLGIDNAPRLHVDVRCRNAVQHLQRIAALDRVFGEARLIEEGAVGHQLLGLIVGAGEPVLAAIGIFIFRLHAIARIPVGALPAVHLAEHGAELLLVVVQRRAPDAARRLRLPVRPMHGVEQA